MQRTHRWVLTSRLALWTLGGLVCLLLAQAPAVMAAPSQQEERVPDIVGGDEAPVGAYPWITALVSDEAPPAAGQFCGGSLIHREWVLTAAHCVTKGNTPDPATTIDVVVNLHRRSDDNGIRRDLQELIVHPQWDSTTDDFDIALLHLAQPIDDVTPVGLAQPSDGALFAPGALTRVMGWGAITEGGPGSDVLLQVDVPIVAQETCRDAYGNLTDRMLCAGLAEGGKDSCQGDSGGPLVADENGVWKQVGVVSFGQGCAQPNAYGVYARVAELYAWVAEHVPLGTPLPDLEPRAYLPQLARNPEPPAPPANPFTNADFEQGRGAGWEEASTNNFPLVIDADLPEGITPRSGQWLAWLGGENNETGSVRQTVTVPAAATTLSYWAWIQSGDACSRDAAKVIVNAGDSIESYWLCLTTATTGWQERRVDLSAFAGQEIVLIVQVETDEDLPGALFLDDFSFTGATP